MKLIVHFSSKTIKRLENMLSTKDEINRGLHHRIDILTIQQKKLSDVEMENTDLIRKVSEMSAIETVLYTSQKEVEDMLKNNNNDVKTLIVMVAALKRELCGNELRKQEIRKQLQKTQSELRMEHEKKK